MSVQLIVGTIATTRFQHTDEAGLQHGIQTALNLQGLDVRREVRLTPTERIDFMVDRIGIEVKVAGSPAEVTRQLRRYAITGAVDHLVLVTTKVRHRSIEPDIFGVPVTVVVPPWM
jgi:hypothetical protein